MIDDRLCQLVERLRRSGYQHRLEVEYQTCESPQDDVEPDFSRSLLKFREQGLVKIVETDGRVIYCSDEHGVQVWSTRSIATVPNLGIDITESFFLP